MTLVDDSPIVIALLQEELNHFKAIHADIYRAKAPLQLKKPDKYFDIVFLDPPYTENLLIPSCFYLEEHGFLANTAYIYLESRDVLNQSMLPSNWEIIKSKCAGQVCYHLALRKALA